MGLVKLAIAVASIVAAPITAVAGSALFYAQGFAQIAGLAMLGLSEWGGVFGGDRFGYAMLGVSIGLLAFNLGVGIAKDAASGGTIGEGASFDSARGQRELDGIPATAGEREAAFKEGLKTAREKGLPSDFDVTYEDNWGVGRHPKAGRNATKELQVFPTRAQADAFLAENPGEGWAFVGGYYDQSTGSAEVFAHGARRMRDLPTGVVGLRSPAAGMEMTIWHEYGHHLFPSRSEDWAQMYGFRMMRSSRGLR